MEKLMLNSIGSVFSDERGMGIKLDSQYIPALMNLEGFSHINVLWWFNKTDNTASRRRLIEKSPYKNSPEMLGAFATRSPERPNPIALSCSYLTYIDASEGIIGLAYIDAEDGSPVLDIKPYTPSLDRVEKPEVPEWCSNWPNCIEDSGDFDWSSVFNF